MAAPLYYTAEMVRALPEDGRRYEVVHGELFVTPSPRMWHQVVASRLEVALKLYLDRQPLGLMMHAPADISWSPDTLVQPDIFVVPLEDARSLDWTRLQRMLLVIEILSPSTSRADRFAKRRLYQEVGVPLYWIVDGDVQTVEIWTPEVHFPRVERERLSWYPAGAAAEFGMELKELFRAISTTPRPPTSRPRTVPPAS